MGSVRSAVQNIIDLTDDLDLSWSQLCKITFWAIYRFLLDKSSPNFNNGYLPLGPFNKSKSILSGLNTWRTRTFATIRQKDVFDHNFPNKALRMMILASRYTLSRSRNLMVPFVLTYDLDLVRSWSLRNHVLGHISVINEQTFNTRKLGSGPFNK